MSLPVRQVRYEVVARSIAFDHEEFSHGDIIDEEQVGGKVYELLKAGLVKRLPPSPEEDTVAGGA